MSCAKAGLGICSCKELMPGYHAFADSCGIVLNFQWSLIFFFFNSLTFIQQFNSLSSVHAPYILQFLFLGICNNFKPWFKCFIVSKSNDNAVVNLWQLHATLVFVIAIISIDLYAFHAVTVEVYYCITMGRFFFFPLRMYLMMELHNNFAHLCIVNVVFNEDPLNP